MGWSISSGGKHVITIDDEPVTTFDDLLVYLESYMSPGDRVSLTVLRAGNTQKTITVVLGQRPRRAPQ
jgi:S1-C subfamily serine protease